MEGLAYQHDLPKLCRDGKIDPAPSFLATRGFFMVHVPGVHPMLEWFAIYIFEHERHYLEVRAVEPETYVDVTREKPFDPEDPATFSLMAQGEVQYQIPTSLEPDKFPQLLQAVVSRVLKHDLLPDRDHSQTWFKELDSLCDTFVWT
jgi:hypothetical protein